MKRLLLALPLVLGSPPAPVPPARVLLLSGGAFRGRLLFVNEKKASFDLEGKERKTLPLERIEEIDFGLPSPAPPGGPFLFLAGGEALPLEGIRAGRKGGLRPRFGGRWLKEIPLDRISGFQWPRRPGRGLPAAVEGLDPSRRPAGRDLLFLVKREKRGRTILEVAATILSLDRRGLVFDFGGKEHVVPLWKVAGAVFGRAPGPARESPRPGKERAPVLEFRRGGRLSGRILRGDGSGLEFAHPLLGEFRVPWEALLRLRPSPGRVLEADRLELLSDRAVPAFDRVWHFSVNRNLEGGPIEIRGKYFETGFVFLPRRSLTFRVPPGFTIFKASLGMEDSGGGRGAALFRVLAGKRKVFERLVRAGREPLEVSLDLGGAGTVSLEADFGPALDVGDHCAFARARLVRPFPGEEAR